jgi:predicted O-methyltransferase YrrM
MAEHRALDTVEPLHARVGWGRVGTGGDLGYDGERVRVGGTHYEHALSTHPPARLLFHLGGAARRFRCRVALNDDVAPGSAAADFTVAVDGRQVAAAHDVVAGEQPRELVADLGGGHLLELLATSRQFAFAHAVWLEPEVDAELTGAARVVDCLRRAEIACPPPLPEADCCVATVASAGFEDLLDDLLGSLAAHARLGDARVVVLLLGESDAADAIVAKYRALPVRCRPLAGLSAASKAVLYSIALVTPARRYLCLDADMLVLDDLRPVLAAIDACADGSVFACREHNDDTYADLGDVLRTAYAGADEDIGRILGEDRGEGAYPLVVNDGTFAGSRAALLALDATIRAMPGALRWLEEAPQLPWRNQLVFNLALARLRAGVELDPRYNVQLYTSDVEVGRTAGRPRAEWQGAPARIVHFNGAGRHKFGELRGLYAAVDDPLVGAGDGDGYDAFLGALRAWVARHGLRGLCWSFYGTTDGQAARVRDPGRLPLFAFLHYLLRSNGARDVLETGTARGVSTACLASAVAHRPEGRVVTIDVWAAPEREELWDALPAAMRACIEPRHGDALGTMRAALEAGERFDVALLDSDHSEEHVVQEIELARDLVVPGGLILVHDVAWHSGTAAALARAEAAGLAATRHWQGAMGEAEDGALGLAVIENRVRDGR